MIRNVFEKCLAPLRPLKIFHRHFSRPKICTKKKFFFTARLCRGSHANISGTDCLTTFWMSCSLHLHEATLAHPRTSYIVLMGSLSLLHSSPSGICCLHMVDGWTEVFSNVIVIWSLLRPPRGIFFTFPHAGGNGMC